MSRGRQRTLFSVGRRFPYAMARVFSPVEVLACFLFGPIRKLTHACALEAARRKIERRSVPVPLAVRRLAVQVQTSYRPLSGTGNSMDFEARPRGRRGCREHAKGNVQPSHVPTTRLCLPSCHVPICSLARVFTVRCGTYSTRAQASGAAQQGCRRPDAAACC